MSIFFSDAATFIKEHYLLPNESRLQQYHERVIQRAIAADTSPSDSLHDQFTQTLRGFAYLGGAKGSINLSFFVQNPMTETAIFDHFAVSKVVQPAMRLLDNLSGEEKAELSMSVDGLAETLMMLGVDYNSYRGRKTAAGIMRTIRDECFDAAIRLTVERGANPEIDVDRYLEEGYGKTLPSDFKDDIRRFGVRHKTILNVSGTTESSVIFFNGVSPGFLPPPNWEFNWTLIDGANQIWQIHSVNPVYVKLISVNAVLPAYCKTALVLNRSEYDQMVEVLRKFIDGSIKNPEAFYIQQLQQISSTSGEQISLTSRALKGMHDKVDTRNLQRMWNALTEPLWTSV